MFRGDDITKADYAALETHGIATQVEARIGSWCALCSWRGPDQRPRPARPQRCCLDISKLWVSLEK